MHVYTYTFTCIYSYNIHPHTEKKHVTVGFPPFEDIIVLRTKFKRAVSSSWYASDWAIRGGSSVRAMILVESMYLKVKIDGTDTKR